MTKERLKATREASHQKYTSALEIENVQLAVGRAIELQSLQGDHSLRNTDNRIEYSALMSLLHDISEGNNKFASLRALSIWLTHRELALTSVTFNDKSPTSYYSTPDQERTLRGLVQAYHEQAQRDNDAKMLEEALKLLDQGQLQEVAVPQARSDKFTAHLESLKPPDVESIVKQVVGG